MVYAPDVVVTHTGRGSRGGSRSVRIRKYFAARNTILFARKHAAAARSGRPSALCLATSLPLQLLWHLPRGDAGDVWLKVRGIADALAGRRPPLDELGLR